MIIHSLSARQVPQTTFAMELAWNLPWLPWSKGCNMSQSQPCGRFFAGVHDSTAHTPRPLVARSCGVLDFRWVPSTGDFRKSPTPELRSRKGRKTSPTTSSNQTITLLQQKGLSEQQQCTNSNSLNTLSFDSFDQRRWHYYHDTCHKKKGQRFSLSKLEYIDCWTILVSPSCSMIDLPTSFITQEHHKTIRTALLEAALVGPAVLPCLSALAKPQVGSHESKSKHWLFQWCLVATKDVSNQKQNPPNWQRVSHIKSMSMSKFQRVISTIPNHGLWNKFDFLLAWNHFQDDTI